MPITKDEIVKSIKLKKPKWNKRLMARLHYIIGWCRVALGLSVWAMPVYHRPKHQHCVFCGSLMKRGRKTSKGALFWCSKCKKRFHLEGGTTKLVPRPTKTVKEKT